MTTAAVLRRVMEMYPEILELPKVKLKIMKDAISYASELSHSEETLSDSEHRDLLKELTGKDKLAPGDRLKAYRMRENLTQSELAKKSGISQANISAMESGRRAIGIQSAKKLAKILDCDYRQLV